VKQDKSSTAQAEVEKHNATSHCVVNFHGRSETFDQVFGSEPISLPEMQQRLWAFVTGNSLMSWTKSDGS